MVEVKWTDQALEDIASIADFIARDSLKYASVQVRRFFEIENKIVNHPLAGKIVPEVGHKNVREFISGQYRIIYRIISKSRVDILTVYHSKRLLKGRYVKDID